MNKLYRVFVMGMFISFLGSLPLGTLNVAAMQISITEGLYAAILFTTGTLIAEIVYVRLSLIAMDWVRRQQKLFRMLEWLTLLIVVALCVASIYAATHPSVDKNVILNSNVHRLLLGLIMGSVNPVQIPFWFGWSTVLFTKGILQPKNSYYNTYIFGIGFGTLIANFVFVFGGRLVADKVNNNQHIMNWVIGGIFAITAIIQIYKMFTKKDVQHQIEHPEEVAKKFEDKFDKIEEQVEKIDERMEGHQK